MLLVVMDWVGIERAVLSCPIPLHFLDSGAAAGMARDLNDHAAQYVARRPTGFGYFATLPQTCALEYQHRAVPGPRICEQFVNVTQLCRPPVQHYANLQRRCSTEMFEDQ